ncbi:MAG: response regulator [Candidatus Moraniibacteriota bacterium]
MKKVLIVEDDSMLSEIYRKKFEKIEEYEVIQTPSGSEAIDKIKKEKPNLVLLDLVLPEKDGFEIIREIRKDKNLDNVMIIPFSNLSQEENREKAEEMGANGFLAKSEYTPGRLVEKVSELLKEIEGNLENSENSSGKQEKENNSKKGKIKEKLVKKQGRSEQGDILMIEDERVFAEVFGIKLENKGFDFEAKENAKEGIAEASVREFELIITDIMMPDYKGSEIVNEIRHTKKNKKTTIFILADETDSKEEIQKAQSLGANKVLDKNKITPESLVEECKQAIKNS